MYADYPYYLQNYGGTAVAESYWLRLSTEASAWIDRLTFQRAASDTTHVNAIKNATCAVVEVLYKLESEGGSDGIVSESIGSSSVTYSSKSSRQQTKGDRIAMAAAVYLESTGLMYSGFYATEYGEVP